ncbi:MAG: Cj0069 family protein [Proteobacteria bacterium]|nr:Cj0069 family protein [Pseudomonadota bacterium]
MANKRYRVALLFPSESAQRHSIDLENTRLAKIAAALRGVGIEVEGAPFANELVEEVRAQLLRVDGVLVWVNPLEQDRDRSILDALLEDVARAGIFVSAHPEVIRKMGTKEVLYRTRFMSWGCDTRLYRTMQVLSEELPRSLAEGAPRVLKLNRGQSGSGVWKVEVATTVVDGLLVLTPDTHVRIRHAKRGSAEEKISLGEFLQRCEPYFNSNGPIIDQVYQPRLTDGMVRCYLIGDRVAGFGEQLVNALYPIEPDADNGTPPEPGPRLYYPPTRSDFQPMKGKLENEWVAELCQTLSIDAARLPVIWDADLLYGPKDTAGADTYVLCEINVSSVYPFPDDALAPLAAATLARLKARR